MEQFKRGITPKQISELTPKQLERLKEWWKPQDGDYYIKAKHGYDPNGWHIVFSYGNATYETKTDEWIPLLDIGQMIELVGEHEMMIITPQNTAGDSNVNIAEKRFIADNLCDCLWQAVKEVFKKEDTTNKTMTECGVCEGIKPINECIQCECGLLSCKSCLEANDNYCTECGADLFKEGD